MNNNPYIKCITNSDRNHLMEAFELYVQTNANCIDLFSSATGSSQPTESNRLFGFMVSPFRFVQMISHPGIQQWLIRFGRVTGDVETDGLEFCLILTGIDEQGMVVTPHFQLLKHHFSPTQLAEGDSEESSTVVGVSLKQQWTQAWFNLMDTGSVPKHICENPYGLLKGYNFPQSDFLMAADSLQSTHAEMIEFRLVNHASAFSPSSVQANVEGTIGVMLGHVNGVIEVTENPDGNGPEFVAVPPFTQKSYYYDISSPCPPTCPSATNLS